MQVRKEYRGRRAIRFERRGAQVKRRFSSPIIRGNKPHSERR